MLEVVVVVVELVVVVAVELVVVVGVAVVGMVAAGVAVVDSSEAVVDAGTRAQPASSSVDTSSPNARRRSSCSERSGVWTMDGDLSIEGIRASSRIASGEA